MGESLKRCCSICWQTSVEFSTSRLYSRSSALPSKPRSQLCSNLLLQTIFTLSAHSTHYTLCTLYTLHTVLIAHYVHDTMYTLFTTHCAHSVDPNHCVHTTHCVHSETEAGFAAFLLLPFSGRFGLIPN